MSYEYFYPGTPYSLDADSGSVFTGYRAAASRIGSPTSIQTANQLQEVSNLLNQGGKVVELQPIQAEVFDQIPKQHFREINRLSKLTGAETTLHAPMIDPAGFTKEGWSESDRESAERQLKDVIERSHDLRPKGNMPITIHASGIPGSEWMPGEENSKGEHEFKDKQIIAVNRETGQLTPIKKEGRFYPEYIAEQAETKGFKEIGAEIREPKDELEIHNRSEWHQNLTQVLFYKNRGDEILEKNFPIVSHVYSKLMKKEPVNLTPSQEAAWGQVQTAKEYLDNSMMVLRSLYSKAYKFGTDEDKITLIKKAKKFEEELKRGGPSGESQALQNLAIGLGDVHPKTFIPVEEFAIEKAAQTLSNVAFHGYDKFGSNAPIVSIENLYPGMAFSRSAQLKDLVKKAREDFVEKAKEEGKSGSEAEVMAKKLIGVTWDVGHLNIMKKEGFEDADIRKETEEIAKYVKHVHLTDNFGFSDSHLPPGMGNVPIKDILTELDKKGYKGKAIVEAGGFVQHFKTSPQPYVLEAMGSPLYSMIQAPYWNQAVQTQGNYFSFPSSYFPEQHFSLYGGGFSSLPMELGGQVPGKASRATGTAFD